MFALLAQTILKTVRINKRISQLVATLLVIGIVVTGFMVVSGRAAGLTSHLPASVARIFARRTIARTAPAPRAMESQERLSPNSTLAVTSTQDFGTGTGSQTSQTASTSFIPNPTSGTTYARAGAVSPAAPIVLA